MGDLIDMLRAKPRKASANEVTLFTQELAWMLRAGIPLGKALDSLGGSDATPSMGPVLAGLRANVRAGTSFSDALAKMGDVFPDAYVNMVRIAEASGTLPIVLERVHADRARSTRLRSKIVSALTYPAFLLLVAAGAMAFILGTVVPQLGSLVAVSGKSEGAISNLIALSAWVRSHGMLLLLGAAGFATLLSMALAKPANRIWLADQLLRLPAIGPVLQSALLAQFCRSVSLLLGAGISFSEALRLCGPLLFSARFRAAITNMEAALRRGEDFLAPLVASRMAPGLLIQLLRVGNETGNLQQGLSEAAVIYEEKLDHALERALALAEPLIIVCVSGVIGLLVYTVIGALISVNDLVM